MKKPSIVKASILCILIFLCFSGCKKNENAYKENFILCITSNETTYTEINTFFENLGYDVTYTTRKILVGSYKGTIVHKYGISNSQQLLGTIAIGVRNNDVILYTFDRILTNFLGNDTETVPEPFIYSNGFIYITDNNIFLTQ